MVSSSVSVLVESLNGCRCVLGLPICAPPQTIQTLLTSTFVPLDLSSPLGHSVNDGIPNDPYSLKYVTVDDAIRSLVDLGPGALMAKFGVTAAYRNIPIHPLSVPPLPDLVVSSDASGSQGFGALWRTQWFFSSGFFLASAPVHPLCRIGSHCRCRPPLGSCVGSLACSVFM